MNNYYLCEKQAIQDYINKRKSAESIKSDKEHNFTAGFMEDLEKKASEMNNILEISENRENATLNISGVLVDREPDIYDAFFGMRVCNYKTIEKSIETIIDKNVKNVTINFNTPGGMVSGVESCREYIQLLSEYVNVTSIVKGQCCSGGVWLASGVGKKPIAENRMSSIGSIGVVVTILDDSEFLSSWGFEEIELTNEQSPDKRPNVQTEHGKQVIIDELNAIYKVFSSNVSEGFSIESKKIDDLKGRVLYADDATKYGLFEKIKSSSEFLTVEKTDENKKPTEEVKMTLKEIFDANPDALAEHENTLQTARAEAKNEALKNCAEILKIEKVTLSKSAIEAIESGKDVKDYAYEKLTAEKDKRSEVVVESVFSSLIEGAQIPEQQDQTVDKTKTEKDVNEEIEKEASMLFGEEA